MVTTAPPAITTPAPDHRNQTVVIRTKNGQTGEWGGAGVIISRDANSSVVITACHVIADADREPDKKNIDVAYADGAVSIVMKADCISHYDLAILHLDGVSPRAVSATIAPIRADDEALAVLGHPNMKLYTSTLIEGALVYDRDAWLDTFYSACSTCAKGDSGGGFWDSLGNLVGIAIELAQDDQGAIYLVSEDISGPDALREITASAGALSVAAH